MNDKTLLKLALAWALIGIVALMFISEYTEAPTIKIIELGEHMGKSVYIQGNVTKATYTDKVTIFDISDGTSEITAIAFEQMNKTIKKGDAIKIFGKVDTYKNELEVVIDRIELTQLAAAG